MIGLTGREVLAHLQPALTTTDMGVSKMADHKIYGNNGAGNVQALDYDRRQVAHLQAVVDRLNAVIDKHNTECEDLRAQLAAANARAD